jgi:DNA invertase Pin-like site-specific DNA recombinase
MGTTTRPQLAKLMKDARCLEFETVLVWRLDRWGRDLANCLASIEELCQLRIGWAAVGQGLDTDSPGAQLIRSVLTAVQAFVGETKSEHIKAGMRKAVKRTYVPSGRPKKVFDRERVHALHAEGKSIRAIAAELKVGRGTVERLLRVPKGS